jgi:hypothetical protein
VSNRRHMTLGRLLRLIFGSRHRFTEQTYVTLNGKTITSFSMPFQYGLPYEERVTVVNFTDGTDMQVKGSGLDDVLVDVYNLLDSK